MKKVFFMFFAFGAVLLIMGADTPTPQADPENPREANRIYGTIENIGVIQFHQDSNSVSLANVHVKNGALFVEGDKSSMSSDRIVTIRFLPEKIGMRVHIIQVVAYEQARPELALVYFKPGDFVSISKEVYHWGTFDYIPIMSIMKEKQIDR
jgi:hypothetical protein